ncbi:MAG TPA: hypothetical protein VGM56_19570 [Byssovorax sp.]|jgi:hypothetical protein
MYKLVALAPILLLTAACTAPEPPAHWPEGGATLAMPAASWRGTRQSVDILPDGAVVVDGKRQFTIDARGRVFEKDKPYALLEPTGEIVGMGDAPLGRVQTGVAIGADGLPFLTIDPSGAVLRFENGKQKTQQLGQWTGCSTPEIMKTCTLVTYVVTVDTEERLDRAERAEYRHQRPESSPRR